MARGIETDPYNTFRFRVFAGDVELLPPDAGFTQVSLPDISVDPVEYREGLFKWTQKFPGIASVGEVTLTRGIFRRRSPLLDWALRAIDGGQRYRTDLTVAQFHIADEFGVNGSPSRLTRLKEAWVSNIKPSADMDASSADVALEEITVQVEEMEVEQLVVGG